MGRQVDVIRVPLGRREAELKVMEFRSEIERFLKRWSPFDYLPVAARMLEDVHGYPDKMAMWPEHFILHSMEANCAYHRNHRQEEVKPSWLRQLFNVYKEYEDPAQMHTLTTAVPDEESDISGLGLYLIWMGRLQFYLQEAGNALDVARALDLFSEERFPVSSRQFRSTFGLGFREFIILCWTLFVMTKARRSLTFSIDQMTSNVLPRDQVSAGIRLMAQTVQDMAQHYRLARAQASLLMEWQLPNSLLGKPLILMDHGNYLVSFRPFLLMRASRGIFDVCRQGLGQDFVGEMGDAFQTYVGSVLAQMPAGTHVFNENELKKKIEGKVCDFAVATQTTILLVECKAIDDQTYAVTQNAIEKSNWVTKVVDGIEQLSNTAFHIQCGDLTEMMGDPVGTKIMGVVITFGHLYFVNGKVYDAVIKKRVKLPEGVENSDQLFAFPPQVLNVGELERMIELLRSGTDAFEVFRDKLDRHPGEWVNYLNGRLKGQEIGLPILQQGKRELMEVSRQLFERSGS